CLMTDTHTPVSYSLSLLDALPISCRKPRFLDALNLIILGLPFGGRNLLCVLCSRDLSLIKAILLRALDLAVEYRQILRYGAGKLDRKSTRLNSSHVAISYAVFCLK